MPGDLIAKISMLKQNPYPIAEYIAARAELLECVEALMDLVRLVRHLNERDGCSVKLSMHEKALDALSRKLGGDQGAA